jgi:putative ABC transport system permease protein
MSAIRLALKNISGSSFRSGVVLLCALTIAGFSLALILVVHGAQDSLRLAMARLGADIIVVPQGAETKVQTALLMGNPTAVWMPQDNLKKIAALPGVAVASPQVYLSSLHGASCCSVSDMFMVAFDPATDFTVQPWLMRNLGSGLRLGETIGGTYVFGSVGDEQIQLYGYMVTLKGNLQPTGTNLDQTLFLTMETAQEMARVSTTQAVKPLEFPSNSISAVLIKLQPGASPHEVVGRILQDVPGVSPLLGMNFFESFRQQIAGLLRALLVVLAMTSTVSLVLLALIFSMASNERRREIGVLRALGATRSFVLASLLSEAAALALSGAAIGVVLASLAVFLFRNLIIASIGVPFLLPSPIGLLALTIGGLAIALLGVTLAAFVPAFRTSRQDPALAMRE